MDDSDNVFVTGSTSSTGFPKTAGAHLTYLGTDEAFVTKINSSGSALVYSTYLGGNGFDEGIGIRVDGSGSTYITGCTRSPDFPAVGAYQTYQGDWDVFLTKLNWPAVPYSIVRT